MADQALKHVVIVGGGTAGWLTAGILAADHRAMHDDGLSVTVVESPTIPILGVGEGTWPCPFPVTGNRHERVTEPVNVQFCGRYLGTIPKHIYAKIDCLQITETIQ